MRNWTKKIIVIALSLGFLFSCSQKKKKTSANLKLVLGGSIGSNLIAGGGMLYGRSDTGSQFSKTIDASTTQIDFDLQNGNWVFSAIIWDGNNGSAGIKNLNGQTRCDVQTRNLNGAQINIVLDLVVGNCSAPYFGNQGHDNNQFPKLDFHSCMNSNDALAYSDLCANGKKGLFTSFQVSLVNHLINNNTEIFPGLFQNGLVSECYSVNNNMISGLATIVANMNIPAGSIASPIKTMIRGFTGSSTCDLANGFEDFIYPFGLQNSNNRSDTNVLVDTTVIPNAERIFLQPDINKICNSPYGLDNSHFASGDQSGAWLGPFAICSPEQFNLIGAANFTSNLNNSFAILKSLSFTGLEFTPIGEAITATVSNAFTGSLYGHHNNLTHINLTDIPGGANPIDKNEIGIIRRAQGTVADPVRINNLNILKSNLECSEPTFCQDVGLLIGRNNGNLIIDNVLVHGHMRGRMGVGGLIGANAPTLPDTTSINNSHSNLFISSRAGGSDVGGLIGMNDGALTLTKSSFAGQASSETDATPSGGIHVGGLIGFSQNDHTVSISESFTKGIIVGDQYIGGLIGKVFNSNNTNSTNINNCYSSAKLSTERTININIGGLVGSFSNSSGSISNSFFADGIISAILSNSPAIDKAGGIAGVSNGTTTNSFHDKLNFDSSVGLLQSTLNPAFGTAFNTGAWTHPDVDFDIPRLSIELNTDPYLQILTEDKIPYLKRECVGTSLTSTTDSGIGSGAATDPKWICNTGQFTSMDNTLYYILKKDLDFSDVPVTGNFLLSAGKYLLDGNNHSISGVNIGSSVTFADGNNYGLFESLSANSEIYNLVIDFFALKLIGGPDILSNNSIGILAGQIAAGSIIDGLTIRASALILSSLDPAASKSTFLGAITGVNMGSIINADISASIQMDAINKINSASHEIFVGGLVGDNQNLISKSRAEVQIGFGAAAAGFDPAVSWYFAGIAGKNSTGSLIEEVSIENFNASFSTINTAVIALAGMVARNQAAIKDSLVQMDFTVNNCIGGSKVNAFILEDNSNASVNNSIAHTTSLNFTSCLPTLTDQLIPAIDTTALSNSTNNFCTEKSGVIPTTSATCEAIGTGTFAFSQLSSTLTSGLTTYNLYDISSNFDILSPTDTGTTWVFESDDSLPFLSRASGSIDDILPGFL